MIKTTKALPRLILETLEREQTVFILQKPSQ